MRIQILPLPSVIVGDNVEEPFALVIDQAGETASLDNQAIYADLTTFAINCGARATYMTADTVEIVSPYADVEPRAHCLPCDNGEASAQGATCACITPCWNPDCPRAERKTPPAVEPETPARSRYATSATMFDKRVVIDWPDGPPVGVSHRDLHQALEGFAQALVEHMAGKDNVAAYEREAR